MRKQSTRIHTGSLIIDKILNRLITFYSGHDVNMIAIELRLKTRSTYFYKKHDPW